MENNELKRAGLRATFPRIKILQVLEDSDSHHMSADTIYKQLISSGEDIGLATIYRVLAQLEKANLVTRHHFETGQSVYEIRDSQHHDHMVCVKCGKILEFYDEEIEEKQKEIATMNGFEIVDHSLVLYGICDKDECDTITKVS